MPVIGPGERKGISGWWICRGMQFQAERTRARIFDANHYLEFNPDVRAAGVDPFSHYLKHGWREGRRPNAWFDPQFYLNAYADVRRAETEPLLHYVLRGALEGRRSQDHLEASTTETQPASRSEVPATEAQPACRSEAPATETRSASPSSLVTAGDRQVASPLFDAGYYLSANPDVRDAGVDPLEHFLIQGYREGRNPSATFSVNYYLRANPDVAAAGINPLVHFALAGKREGRLPRRPLDAWRSQLEATSQRNEATDSEPEKKPRSLLLQAKKLSEALASASSGPGLVVAVSHDDYLENCGGVQILIGDEQGAFGRSGWAYLHISPDRPRRGLRDSTAAEAFHVALRLDGLQLGTASFADLLLAISYLRARGTTIRCVIHHLMGHAPELLGDLVSVAGDRNPIVWIHDFFTLCPSITLMRNDVAFCGAPPVDSGACSICCYGEARHHESARLHSFFRDTQPTILAPSAVALAQWHERSDLQHAACGVVPLARLRMPDARAGEQEVDFPSRRTLRVAHIGARAFNKGWPVFEELARQFADDDRFQFFHLGVPLGPMLPSYIRQVPVRVNPEHRDAMVSAVAESRIDVVVLWSLWPETFCYVVHEAIAGGAYVVARKDAGNIWPAIATAAPDRGCTVEAEADLFALFRGDELHTRLVGSPLRRGKLIMGKGTADWLLSGQDQTGGVVTDVVAAESVG